MGPGLAGDSAEADTTVGTGLPATRTQWALGRLGPNTLGHPGTARLRPGPVSLREPSGSRISPRLPAKRQGSADRATEEPAGLSPPAGPGSRAGAGRPWVRAPHSPLPQARSWRNHGPNSPRRLLSPCAARQLTSRQKSAGSDWMRPEKADQCRRAVVPGPAPVRFRGRAAAQVLRNHVSPTPNHNSECQVR